MEDAARTLYRCRCLGTHLHAIQARRVNSTGVYEQALGTIDMREAVES